MQLSLCRLLFIGCTVAVPSVGLAQQTNCPDAQTFFEFQVTTQARWIPDSSSIHPIPKSPTPQSVVQFVVDTAGVPDMKTFKFLLKRDSSSQEEVRRTAAAWRFTPSVANGCRVRQLVQTPIGK